MWSQQSSARDLLCHTRLWSIPTQHHPVSVHSLHDPDQQREVVEHQDLPVRVHQSSPGPGGVSPVLQWSQWHGPELQLHAGMKRKPMEDFINFLKTILKLCLKADF